MASETPPADNDTAAKADAKVSSVPVSAQAPPPIPPYVRYLVFAALALLLMGGMGLYQVQHGERRALAALDHATSADEIAAFAASYPQHRRLADQRLALVGAMSARIRAADAAGLAEIERTAPDFRFLVAGERAARQSASGGGRDARVLASIRAAASFAELDQRSEAAGAAYRSEVDRRRGELTAQAIREIESADTLARLDALVGRYAACCADRIAERKAEIAVRGRASAGEAALPKPQPPSAPRRFTEYVGYDIEGGDRTAGGIVLDTPDRCRDTCSAEGWCLYYSYDLVNRQCYLKDKKPVGARREGLSISGAAIGAEAVTLLRSGSEIAIRKGRLASATAPEVKSASSDAICYGLCLRGTEPTCLAARFVAASQQCQLYRARVTFDQLGDDVVGFPRQITPASTAEAAAFDVASRFEQEANVDYDGGDRASAPYITGSTARECASTCAGRPWCRFFSFDRWNRDCYLKDSPGIAVHDARVQSGRLAQVPPLPSSRAPHYMKQHQRSTFGAPAAVTASAGSARRAAARSAEACSDSCLAAGNPQCEAFEFSASSRDCWHIVSPPPERQPHDGGNTIGYRRQNTAP